MKTFVDKYCVPHHVVYLASALLVFGGLATTGHAQQSGAGHQSHSASPAVPSGDEASLAEQLRQLQSKVAQLEASMKQNHQAMGSSPAQPGGMAEQGMRMMDMEGMGMTEQGMGRMGSMQSGQGMSGMGMMSRRRMGAMSGQGMDGMSGMGMGRMGMMDMEGMRMMGQMPGMGSMQMPSALPGFPGASHIYHIGATGFFLDHPQHIRLTPDQQAALNRIKQKALLDQSTVDRWIDQAEQEIWVLTSSDSPDVSKIEAKVREVAKMGGDKRIAFIRAVGEAAMVLTDEQRQVLAGQATPSTSSVNGEQQ